MKRNNTILHIGSVINIVCIILSSTPQKGWNQKVAEIDGIPQIANNEKGLWEDNPSKKLILKHQLTIGDPDGNSSFYLIGDITTDQAGNIYVSDMKDHCIKVFTANGRYVHTIGRQGQGPGEFRQPENIAVGPNNNLFVFDRNRRISIISSTGDYKSSFNISVTPTALLINEKSEVILSPRPLYVRKPGPMIYVYSLEGKQITAYNESISITEEEDESGLSQFASCYVDRMSSGNILAVFEYPYLIRIFNPDGKLIKIITLNSDRFTKPEILLCTNKSQYGSSRHKTRVMRSFITGIFYLPDGNFFTTVWDYGADYKNKLQNFDSQKPPEFKMYIDLFDKEGCFLKSFEYDPLKYGIIKHVDTSGKIYFIYNSRDTFPIVSIYRLEFS